MILPRRVPWATLAELDQLCSWIYADKADFDSKLLAIHRLSAWRAITYLPHALDSTLALLVSITRDDVAHDTDHSLFLRQSYAAAIIRLVNGFVDPLQLGAYARSIASIANQIGLPQWLVELRHAATHEDLPSLELLREAAVQSLNWLLHHYFLPILNPSSAVEPRQAPLQSLGPLLKQYKSLCKITTRDVSLSSAYKSSITVLVRSIERWISEAKVAANLAAGDVGWVVGSQSDSAFSDDHEKEQWALEKLCDALLDRGALVPLSRKKRVGPSDTFFPPATSIQIWSPLLHHLQEFHPELPSIVCGRIIAFLSDRDESNDENKSDTTFETCLARWVFWVVDTWPSNSQVDDRNLRQEVVINLMQALGRNLGNGFKNHKIAIDLLQRLCHSRPEWESPLNMLLQSSTPYRHIEWQNGHMDTMDERLERLQTLHQESETCVDTSSSEDVIQTYASGWKLLNTTWKPCPIGVHWATV